MGKHAQIIMGPAGSGKSTYCQALHAHCENVKRSVHIVNLDPAAEHFNYPVSIDIRDLISLDDAMEELDLGPNGGLIYCMEYLVDNMDWLAEQINDFGDDYLIFDCPGQVELYSHLDVMPRICRMLQKWGYNLVTVYLLDSLVVTDASRFISGTLMCLSAMVQLEMPHINLLTKCDLIKDKKKIDDFLDPDSNVLLDDLNKKTVGGHRRLNESMSTLIEDYGLVSYLPLDITDDDSMGLVLAHIDNAVQYGEDLEFKETGNSKEYD